VSLKCDFLVSKCAFKCNLYRYTAEMDGLEPAGGSVLVVATTNRPGAMDAALMRPGRLDLVLYVPPPDCAGRAAALRVHARGVPLAMVGGCTQQVENSLDTHSFKPPRLVTQPLSLVAKFTYSKRLQRVRGTDQALTSL
jgi:hypothetical protein